MQEDHRTKPGVTEDLHKVITPVLYPDHREEKTNVALPSDENVKAAKDWVDYNQK